GHGHAVGVDVADADTRLGILRRDDLDRAALIHAEAPLGNVEVMSAPVGHHATRVLLVIAAGREEAVDSARAPTRVGRPFRRRPDPAIPVEALFHLLFWQVARFAG